MVSTCKNLSFHILSSVLHLPHSFSAPFVSSTALPLLSPFSITIITPSISCGQSRTPRQLSAYLGWGWGWGWGIKDSWRRLPCGREWKAEYRVPRHRMNELSEATFSLKSNCMYPAAPANEA